MTAAKIITGVPDVKHDRYADLVNTLLAELRLRGRVDVIVSSGDEKGGWTASAVRGSKTVEVGAGGNGEAAMKDLIVRLAVRGI